MEAVMFTVRRTPTLFAVLFLATLSGIALSAQNPTQPLNQAPLQRDPLTPAPARATGEGFGPYKTMAIRGAMLIDGTGGPPRGPVDIVVEGNRITAIRNAGTPGLPVKPNRPPKADYEIDATGMYVLPGFVDLHVHAGGAPKNPDAEYPYKLWLAHGVTTVRGVPITDNALAVKEKDRSARNEIVAPRIFNYQRPGSGWGKGIPQTAEQAHAWAVWAHDNGIDGLKLGAERPDLMEIYCQDAKKLGMGTTAHLQQTGVVQVNAIKAARMGLGTVTHFYGHFESLMNFYTPNRANHGAYWYDWTTDDEVAFRNFYQVWFKLMNDYKKMGGRVTTGSDSGFIYQTYGFGYINELELLQEAGFHPLEVIQSATMNGAATLYEPMHKSPEIGIVREGMLADMVIVDQNPLQNFKVLYANGALKLNDKTGRVERVGGIKWTIKDGIAYDAKKLAADVAAMVDKQKRGPKTTTSAGR